MSNSTNLLTFFINKIKSIFILHVTKFKFHLTLPYQGLVTIYSGIFDEQIRDTTLPDARVSRQNPVGWVGEAKVGWLPHEKIQIAAWS